MVTWLKKEAKIIATSVLAGLTLAVLVGAYTFVYSDQAQREIAENVLRFHVLAHNNDPAEQALKDEVRDAILVMFEEYLTEAETLGLSLTREMLYEALEEITAHASTAVTEAGVNHPVTAEITHAFFPTTTYGNLTFPPGRYETLQITIGDGVGRNWWCLMFPPLCYVEMTSTTQTHNLLEEAIPPAGIRLLTHQESDSTAVQVRFRVVEWWQNRRAPAAPDPGLQRAAR